MSKFYFYSSRLLIIVIVFGLAVITVGTMFSVVLKEWTWWNRHSTDIYIALFVSGFLLVLSAIIKFCWAIIQAATKASDAESRGLAFDF